MFISFTQVDAVTGISVMHAKASNGPAMPDVPGLKFGFALESQYPTETPTYYGTCDDNADPTEEGIIAVLTADQYSIAQVSEMQARLASAQAVAYDGIAAKRYEIESAGITFNTMGGVTLSTPVTIQTGVEDQVRIDTALNNMERYSIKSVQFKAANNTWVDMSYDNLHTIGSFVAARVQACFAAESTHSKAVAAMTTKEAVEAYDYTTGWPT